MRIGTRGSRLALWQAQAVADALAAAGHGPCEIVTLKTSGDRLQEKPLSEQGGKRLFVKEIEDALLLGDVDAAVHSAKDMPADLPPGLVIGGVLPREDPRDALVLARGPGAGGWVPGDGSGDGISAPSDSDPPPLFELRRGLAGALAKAGAWQALGMGPQRTERKVGTGSIRRIAQLRAAWPEARFEPTRGNVDTRLRKLDEGQFDALVLAAAGLKRLGFGERISSLIPLGACVPAPGQGTIAIEIRSDDRRARAAVASLNHEATAIALEAERGVVDGIGGGCQLPLGAVAIVADGAVDLQAVVIAPDGSRIARARVQGAASHPRDLGRRAADELAAAGAREILDALGIRG